MSGLCSMARRLRTSKLCQVPSGVTCVTHVTLQEHWRQLDLQSEPTLLGPRGPRLLRPFDLVGNLRCS